MTTPLSNARGEIQIDVSGVKRSVDSAVATLNRMKSGVMSVAGVMGGAFLAGTTALAGGLAAITVSGVKMAQELQAQMSSIQAVMGASTDEVKQLEDAIVELGLDPNLKVSTQEAAAAIEMLGRNGLTTQEILDGAARSTVLLSNATGGDFAQSADIATDVMALFNIEAADMITAVDGITSVVTNSKFSVNDYALALAQGGGVAATAGVEFADFNTTIAAISPLFASGSDAGTSFKTMLQRMANPTGKAIDAMMELGLVTEDGKNQFYDAEGSMRSMSEIAGILAAATANLTEEQKAQALSTIFGSDAIRAASGLALAGADANLTAAQAAEIFGVSMEEAARMVENGINQFDVLQATMGNTSAADAAATRMDNLAGSLEILEGVVDAIKIKIGQAFLGVLKQAAEVVTSFLDANGDRFVAFFETAAGVIETFVDSMQSGGDILGGITVAIQNMTLNPELRQRVLDVSNAIRDLIEKAVTFVQDHAEEFKGALIGIGAVLAGATVLGAIITVGGAIASLFNPITLIIGAAAAIGAAWAGNWGGIRDKTQEVIDFIRPYVEGAVSSIRSFWEENGASILATVQTTWGTVQSTVVTTIATISEILGQLGERIKPGIDMLAEFATQIVSAFKSGGIKGAVQQFLNLWPAIKTVIMATISNVVAWLSSKFGTDLTGIFGRARSVIQTAWSSIRAIISSVIAVIGPALSTFWENLKGSFSSFAPIADSFKAIWPSLQTVLQAALATIGAAIVVVIGLVTGVINGIAEAIGPFMETIANVVNYIVLAFGDVLDFFISFYDMFVGMVTGNGELFVQGWKGMVEAVISLVTNLALGIGELIVGLGQTLAALIQGIVDGVIGFFTHLYEELVGHSIVPDMVNAIIAWVVSLKDQFIALVFNLALTVLNKFLELKTNAVARVLELKNEAVNKFIDMKSAIIDKIELLKIAAAYKFLLIKTAVVDKLIEMKDAAVDKVLLLKNSLSDKFDEIKGAIAAKVALFVQVGRDLMTGLKDGAMEMASQLIAAVTGPINDAIAAAKALLGISSPSKVFTNFGVQTFMGYIVAAKQMTSKVKTAVTDALTPAINRAQQLAIQPLPNLTGAPLPAFAGAAGQSGAVNNTSNQVVNHYHINGLVIHAKDGATSKSLLQDISDKTIGGGGQSY